MQTVVYKFKLLKCLYHVHPLFPETPDALQHEIVLPRCGIMTVAENGVQDTKGAASSHTGTKVSRIYMNSTCSELKWGADSPDCLW